MEKKKSQEQSKKPEPKPVVIKWDGPGRFQDRRRLFELLFAIKANEKHMQYKKEQLLDWEKQLRTGNIKVKNREGNKLNKQGLRETIEAQKHNLSKLETDIWFHKEDLYNLIQDRKVEEVKEEILRHKKFIETETLGMREALKDVI